MRKTFIFDLDDTLMPNQEYYSYAQAKFITFVLDTIGPGAPNAQTILNLQVEKDLAAVEQQGFQSNRFPESFRDTFLELAYNSKLDRKKTVRYMNQKVVEAYNLGAEVFDESSWKKNGLLDGAAATLNFLQGKMSELILLTAGDEEIQIRKTEVLEMKKWFGDQIYITPQHKRKKIQEIATVRNSDYVWLVGNSARSDIIPALDSGIGAIHIPLESWAYDANHSGIPQSKRLITLDEIGQLPKIYHKL